MELADSVPQSPREMFIFSMIHDGARGLRHILEEEPIEDLATYGVDWETLHDRALMRHFLQENPQEWEDENPFTTPGNLSHVPCEPPNCPLSQEEIGILNAGLQERVDLNTGSMLQRRQIWLEACNIAEYLVATRT